MPAPLIPLAIAAGSSIFQGLYNAGSTRKENARNREFQLAMYERSRKDALADWEMQNEYNSPAATMERLRKGGLNPNLVYGSGTATQPAGAARAPMSPSYKGEAPQIDTSAIGNASLSYYDAEIKQAQVRNLETQNTVMAADAVMKLAQTENIGVTTETGRFDLGMKETLKDVSIDMAKKTLEKIAAETKSTLSNAEVQVALKENTLKKGVYEVLQLRANTAHSYAERDRILKAMELLETDTSIRKIDLELYKQGIPPGSPWYVKSLEMVLKKYLGIGDEWEEGINMKEREKAEQRRSGQGHGPRTPWKYLVPGAKMP